MRQGRTFLPAGRPYLLESSGKLNLLYLSWGKRKYGELPIPVTLHEGWVCSLILSGSPRLIFSDERTRIITRNQMVVCRPDHATGWKDESGKTCDQLTWVWGHSAPTSNQILQSRRYAVFTMTEMAVAQLKQNHLQCREEITVADQFTGRALKALHEHMQITLNRSLGGNPKSVNRFEFAVAWLRRHAWEEKAVTRLAEYLQISLSTLDRLFQKNVAISASAWIHSEKMRTASDLLKTGKYSRKQVAYKLGYRHPCDFSRAWSRWAAKSKASPR